MVRRSHEAILGYWSKDKCDMGNLVDAVRSLENSMRSKSAAYEVSY